MERRSGLGGLIDRVIRRPAGGTTASKTQPQILSREEMTGLMDRRLKQELGMSYDEFVVGLHEGTLPDTAEAEHLAVLAGVRVEPSQSQPVSQFQE